MACTNDSLTDSDTSMKLSKNHSSRKKIVSSSEEEMPVQPTPTVAENNGTADGRRRSQRRRRKAFSLPSKKDVWSAIPSVKAASDKPSRLMPRKLINDFTRVTHRYNYDYVEVSGEESMEEFIKDSSSDCGAAEKDKPRKKGRKRPHRVKGYRTRIAKVSESSEEEAEASESQSKKRRKSQLLSLVTQCQTAEQHMFQCRDSPKKPKTFMKSEDSDCENHDAEEVQATDDEVDSARSKKTLKKQSVLESDSEELSSPDEPPKSKSRKSSKQPIVNSDSDNHTQSSVSSQDSQNIKIPGRARVKSALDSDSEPGEQGSFPESKDEKARSSQNAASGCTQTEQKLSKVSDTKTSNSVCSQEVYVHGSSDDSAVTDDDSRSDSGSDSQFGGRIQKLAALKRKQQVSMFTKLKSAREKRQKAKK